ncbi:MAG TPA: DNA-formamidopyrimidine glycosylase family protein [Polyangiaceae bacterium]|nr:DNA-formamidopyrimidine glycosylase family protein [Polyangiaceae bacterium]
MPELPDITVYVECLQGRLRGHPIESVRILHPFVLRSFEPSAESSCGCRVLDVSRLGKRIVLELSGELFWVIHLMIAGRLRWLARGENVPRRLGLAAFDLPHGTLLLTEAGTTRRASLHLVRGRSGLDAFRRKGVEPLDVDRDRFMQSLRRENHTIKRALTDPDIVSGIGNAYSDEILHAAMLSPVARTQSLDDESLTRLHDACKRTLKLWVERLRREVGDGFPKQVTAFHAEMAVHGRFGQPCPVCQTKVQRIRYASNECDYCPTCQTGGRLLADRGLSRLLRDDWPRSLEELDEHLALRKGAVMGSDK